MPSVIIYSGRNIHASTIFFLNFDHKQKYKIDVASFVHFTTTKMMLKRDIQNKINCVCFSFLVR